MPYKNEELRKEKSNIRWKSWAQKNPEQANSRMRAWRQRNPNYMLCIAAKRRALKDGIPFDITPQDIPPIPEVCPIALIPLFVRNDGNKGPCNNSPTLDRIDPTKGYVVGNIRIISHKGNRWKSDMTIADLERIIAYMKSETQPPD